MHEQTSAAQGEFLVRPVAAADNEALAQVLRDVMTEFGADGAGSSIHDPEVADMAAAYCHPGSAFFVAEARGRLVGGGGLGPLAGGDARVCELRKMYLRPEARGHGVGHALLARCLEAAIEFGYARIYLETRQSMRAARRLYEMNGFSPVSKPLGLTGHFGCDAWYVRDL